MLPTYFELFLQSSLTILLAYFQFTKLSQPDWMKLDFLIYSYSTRVETVTDPTCFKLKCGHIRWQYSVEFQKANSSDEHIHKVYQVHKAESNSTLFFLLHSL